MFDAPQGREWRFYLDDMVGFCQRVLAFTAGLDQSQFVGDALRFDATVRNIELIGEAATHIPDAVRTAHPEIPGPMVIATRNRLIHDYLGVDNDTLWSMVTTDVPNLLPALQAIPKQA